MKTCITCKHYRNSFTNRLFFIAQFSKCAHPTNADPIVGGGGLYCKLAREIQGSCEKTGKLWEAK